MNSQRLTIHAKRVTINEKDTELLRDMIFTIDPTNGLGQASNERVVGRRFKMPNVEYLRRNY